MTLRHDPISRPGADAPLGFLFHAPDEQGGGAREGQPAAGSGNKAAAGDDAPESTYDLPSIDDEIEDTDDSSGLGATIASLPWPVIVVIVAAIGFAVYFGLSFGDPVPRKITIATGTATGAYHAFGEKYRDALAKDGIEVELRQTAGSVENLQLLSAGEVDLAFVQGGVVGDRGLRGQSNNEALASLDLTTIRGLASLYSEPLWVLLRGENPPDLVPRLRGRKLAIGPVGSGTEPLARELLRVNGVTAANSEILTYTFPEAVEALHEGTVDAAFFVTAPSSEFLAELLALPDIRLMNFRRYEAYARNLTFLKRIEIPEGLLDLRNNVPPNRVILLAATATLCSREDLHPRLVDLLLGHATTIHKGPTLLDDAGEFPSPKYVEFELHEGADNFHRNGPSFLSRWLPFWGVLIINRLLLIALPLIGIALPLAKIAPAVYKFGMNRRILKWYGQLDRLEVESKNFTRPTEFDRAIRQLRAINEKVADMWVPGTYHKNSYDLRLHIELVEREMRERRKSLDEQQG